MKKNLIIINRDRWRLLIPLLPLDYPLFVPDLPGYGSSACPKAHSKLDYGLLLLQALRELIPDDQSPISVVLVGHDRGARIAHRLQVSAASKDANITNLNFDIIGLGILDIVPTNVQWQSVGKSPAAQVSTFHWAFLANVGLASDLIRSYGGGKWAKEMILKWAGSNEVGLANLKSGNSLDVYGSFFDNPSVIKATCQDYEAGATTDVIAQTADQVAGRKVNIPVLLIYGEEYLGWRVDVKEEWQNFVTNKGLITNHPLSNGIGHFVVEEAPEETAAALVSWIESLKPSEL
jgi:pimeloyl-ACP methyl ester carboxylesterase